MMKNDQEGDLHPQLELPHTQILHVLANYDPDLAIETIERFKAGIMNQVFALHLTNGQRLVLRYLAAPDGANKARKEALVNRLLAMTGIPVPMPLYTEITEDAGYIVSTYLPGDMLSEALPTMDEATAARLYANLGTTLARIHTVTLKQFGEIGYPVSGPEMASGYELTHTFDSWRELFNAMNAFHLQSLVDTEYTDLVAPVRAYLDARASLVPDVCEPSLLHMDFHASNLLVMDDQVCGVLDVEGAIAGHAEFGLMRTELLHFRDERRRFRDVFLQAYGEVLALSRDYESRFNLYYMADLLRRMHGMLVYEQRSGPVLTPQKRETREQVEMLLWG
jgi:aminoglycoside phosphotransferase (APT) family kinase protein